VSFQDLCDDDDNFLKRLRFSNEATFHVSGKVNKPNVRIWGTEKPHRIVENERDSPKTNVFCAISMSKVYGPYFFPDRTVNGEIFRNTPTTWLMPQLEHDSADFVYQLDGAPCHYQRNVRNFLNETLPHRWIGRAVNNDQHLLLWPPRSPDLTPCDFFLWGYVKDNACKPSLPQNVRELQARIRAVVQTIDGNMLKRVWQELDYCIDICRVTKGAHIEHL